MENLINNIMTDQQRAEEAIIVECENIKNLLLEKNRDYGNSAYDPIRCFSKVSPVEGINIRMDDKLSRLMRGENAGEDPELDLVGYIVLKRAYPRYEKLANTGRVDP